MSIEQNAFEAVEEERNMQQLQRSKREKNPGTDKRRVRTQILER